MNRLYFYSRPMIFAVAMICGFSSVGETHSGIVDGYGCHRGPDKIKYHCHQGNFAGRTFKSKEDFLRELRSGKSQQLRPSKNPPQLDGKRHE